MHSGSTTVFGIDAGMVRCIYRTNFYKITCILRIVSTSTSFIIGLFCSTSGITIFYATIYIVCVRRTICNLATRPSCMHSSSTTVFSINASMVRCVYWTGTYYIRCTLRIVSTRALLIVLASRCTCSCRVLNSTVYCIRMWCGYSNLTARPSCVYAWSTAILIVNAGMVRCINGSNFN